MVLVADRTAGADTAADEGTVLLTFMREDEIVLKVPRPWAGKPISAALAEAEDDLDLPPWDDSRPVVLRSKGIEWGVAPRDRGIVLNPGDELILQADDEEDEEDEKGAGMTTLRRRSLPTKVWIGLLVGVGLVAIIVGGRLHSFGQDGWICALPFYAAAFLLFVARSWRPREMMHVDLIYDMALVLTGLMATFRAW